jgi:hypothetical protein
MKNIISLFVALFAIALIQIGIELGRKEMLILCEEMENRHENIEAQQQKAYMKLKQKYNKCQSELKELNK